jgi:hypothetical protein
MPSIRKGSSVSCRQATIIVACLHSPLASIAAPGFHSVQQMRVLVESQQMPLQQEPGIWGWINPSRAGWTAVRGSRIVPQGAEGKRQSPRDLVVGRGELRDTGFLA